MNKQELIGFEEDIKEAFLRGKIRAPVHLSRGNEDTLIEIFKEIKPDDWVFATHRSHYHALLKGIPKEWLRNEILAGRSIHINSAKHKFFTSAIVGGCCPIALGLAMAIKRKGLRDKVWVFIGDMAAETGGFHECAKYAMGHNLPMTFVIEDNEFSVQTPTQEAWGKSTNPIQICRYKYKNEFPHQGVGIYVLF